MTIGDTAAISQGVGAFASRQAVNAGSSALIAGQAVRKQLIALAARALAALRRASIDLEDGQAIARRGNKPSISFADLARLAQGIPGVSLPPVRLPGSSTPPITRRRRPLIAPAPTSPKCRSTP